jgi:hypothetical protein
MEREEPSDENEYRYKCIVKLEELYLEAKLLLLSLFL